MRRILCAVATLALSITVASAFAGSTAVKRYAFSANHPAVTPGGMMTVLLPAEWRVSTRWSGSWYDGRTPTASDPAHRWVTWSVDTLLMRPGATLADMRSVMLLPVTSNGKPARLVVGDAYLALPVGKVWRATFKELIPSALIRRLYVLDRGVVRKVATGEKKELFTRFWVSCSPQDCKQHNDQLAAIMRSVRIEPLFD